MNWVYDFLQKLYPIEFRIQEPAWPVPASSLTELSVQHSWSSTGQNGCASEGLTDTQRKLVVSLATNLWRTRQKMIDPASGEPPEHMKRAFRHVRSMWDTLLENGIEIQDHTNQPFHLGQALNAIAFEPRSSLVTETVIETVKPTVYYNKKVIQVGDVIVGIPGESPE